MTLTNRLSLFFLAALAASAHAVDLLLDKS